MWTKGANPADLPTDRSSRLEFVVNMKTARVLGVEISASVLGCVGKIL